MDKKKLNEFREKLQEKQTELTREFSRSKNEATSDLSGGGTEDFVDYAVSAYTKEFLLSLSDLERKTLQLVDDSLVRIQRGEFGICLECEKVISEKRLNAVPWTPFCITCQERIEQQESRAPSQAPRPFLD